MVINQPFGIGDIIFLEPLFRHFWKVQGKKPILPVRDHLLNLQPAFGSVEMVPLSKASYFDINSTSMDKPEEYLPLRFANQIVHGYDVNDHHDFEHMMADKYILAGLDPDMWKQVDLNFSEAKCGALLDYLTGEQWDDFILVNEHSAAGRVIISTPLTPFTRISMVDLPGYSVIDWAFVMLYARANHHVSTSTFYMMQALKNKFPKFGENIYIYPRPNIDGLRGISQLKPTFNYVAVR